MEFDIPCIIFCRDLQPDEIFIKEALEHSIPVLSTGRSTSGFMAELIYCLGEQLAPCITVHGVLVDVYGEGVMITGESGIGKSEAALELIRRGHRLVTDDVVEIRKINEHTLMGTSPEITRHFIELRGIGIIDVKTLYGVECVKEKQDDNHGSNDEQTVVSTEETTAAREVVWIDNKEPESKEQEYIAPEGVYLPYFIKVNRAANCATVYGIDENGEYTIPVKAFATSCGKAGDETIVGENYVTSDKYEWGYMVDGTYGRYAFRISGGYLFHSVPYYSMNKGDLEDGQYNKLGDYASLGCVRMCVRDVKWIYDNCPSGTGVTIYDDAVNPGPLGKPDSIKIPEDSAYAGWDPTDPDENNPWNAYSAKIEGAKDIQTKIGQSVDVMTGVTATDTCGNDITAKIVTVGRYTFDQTGTYDIKYEVTDAIGSHDEVTVKLMVTE